MDGFRRVVRLPNLRQELPQFAQLRLADLGCPFRKPQFDQDSVSAVRSCSGQWRGSAVDAC